MDHEVLSIEINLALLWNRMDGLKQNLRSILRIRRFNKIYYKYMLFKNYADGKRGVSKISKIAIG